MLKNQPGFPDRDLVTIPKPMVPARDVLTVDRYRPTGVHWYKDIVPAVATNVCLNGTHSINNDIAGGAASDGNAIIQLHHRSLTTVVHNQTCDSIGPFRPKRHGFFLCHDAVPRLCDCIEYG